jgi:hypothetical protein
MAKAKTIKECVADPRFLRALKSASLDAGYNNITLSDPRRSVDLSDGAIEQLIREMADQLLSRIKKGK